MSHRKTRAVFNADSEQLAKVRAAVRSGQFESTSAFLREAVSEKLRGLENRVMAAQLERACASETKGDDALIGEQAWDD